tara:strand:- start:4107 stop:5102 length:996 start_codon:yes stop_codon:yes gene_type:complete
MQQAEQLKINVSNIRSSLLIGTKRTQVLKIRKEKLLEDIEQKKLIEQEEKNLEQTKKPKKISVLKSPVKKVANVFDNILKFGSIILTGILVNALPKMMDTIKEVFNSISGFFSRVFNFFKPFISFVTGINFEDKESENKKLIDEAENLKKKLKPLDDVTNKVGKLTGDFNKAAEKSGVSTGGGGDGSGTSGTESSSESTTTTTTTTDKSDSSTTVTGTKTEKELEEEGFYKEKLKEAETRRIEYVKNGETSKIVGVDEKIEFYKKKLGINPLNTTILVQDSDGKVQKLDSSQLKSKNNDTISMLNNGGDTNGSKTIIVQRQIVQTNIAVPV